MEDTGKDVRKIEALAMLLFLCDRIYEISLVIRSTGAEPCYVLADLLLLPVPEVFSVNFVLREKTVGLLVCFTFYVVVRWPRFASVPC